MKTEQWTGVLGHPKKLTNHGPQPKFASKYAAKKWLVRRTVSPPDRSVQPMTYVTAGSAEEAFEKSTGMMASDARQTANGEYTTFYVTRNGYDHVVVVV